jgi:glutathione peroxidase
MIGAKIYTMMGILILTISAALAAHAGPHQEATLEPDTGKVATDSTGYLDYPFLTITGDTTRLADFNGKVLLVVNTASECGFTPQYAGLEKLYRKYKDRGLVVIGFPANNFGGQEPGTNKEILNFCTTKFDVTFPMMSKISVKGEDKHPLFVYLTEESPLPGEIQWNFSKFLLDKNGRLAARYPSKVTPMDSGLVSTVEALLSK